MVRGEHKLRSLFKIILILAFIIILLYLGWLFFLSYNRCDDKECFNANLAECTRTKYSGGTGMVYEYLIVGKEHDTCNVLVKLLQGELNNQNSIRLEGKSMTCALPLGLVMNPESDMGNCHGELKEGLQDLIIQKLHSYLVQNLGKINLEILNTPGQ